VSLSVGELLAYLRLDSTQFDRGIRTARTEMTSAAGTADKLEASVGASSAALSGAGRQANVAAMGSAKFRAAQLSAVAATERYNTVLAQGNASVGRLAAAEAAVIRANRAVIASNPAAAIRETNAAAAATPGLMARSAAGFVQAGKMVLGLGAAFGAFELAKKTFEFVGAGKELTTSLNGVQAAARATDAQMANVRAETIALGKDLTVPAATAVDAANAIEDLVKAGVSLDRAMAAARPALLLAAAANVETADSARVLGDVLDEFQLDASKAGEVANYLAAGANAAGGGLMDMFQAFTYIGPRGRAVGLGVADIAAAITDLAKGGIQADRAGTGLAMMLQKIAAPTDKSKKALEDLGVEAWDAQGRFVGLAPVIDQLSSAQKRFGPNSQRFIKDISDAFGARAANVVAAFAGKGVESYNHFLTVIKSGDVQKFADLQNRGVAAAFRQISKQATAAGIDVYQKLEPALANAAWWLGTKVPSAISMLAHSLGPTIDLVGTGLGGAFHVLAAIIGPVLSGLGSAVDFLSKHGVISDFATAVLALWLAFKGYTIAVAAFKAVQTAIILTRVRLLELREAGILGAAALGAIVVGAYAGGKALTSLIESGRAGVYVLDHMQESFNSLNTAIVNNAAHAQQAATEWAKGQIQASGLADKAAAAGITTGQLAAAITGNDKAMQDLIATWKASGAPSDSTLLAAATLHGIYGKLAPKIGEVTAATKANAAASTANAAEHHQEAVALQWVVNAHGRLVQVEATSKSAADAATGALTRQTTASTLLKQAMDLLNGVNESLETSTNQFSIALGGLRNGTALATNAAGDQVKSLNQSTVAGATNRQMLVGLIDAAKAQAQATADQAAKHHTLGAALKIGNAQLAGNEAAIRKAAVAAGLDKGEVNKLITSMGILAKVHPKPHVTLPGIETAMQQVETLRQQLASLHDTSLGVSVGADGLIHLTGGGKYATGSGPGGVPDGLFVVGEEGPELGRKSGDRLDILSHPKSKRFLNATGMKVPGFASGTINEKSFLHSTGGSVYSEQSAFAAMLSVAQKAGISSALVKTLHEENRMLDTEMRARDRIAARLERDTQKLSDALRKRADESRTVKGAVTGSFDVTTAGTGFDGNQPVTGGSMLAQEKQAAARAKLFVADIKKLTGKVGNTYLYQLAAKGPDALPEVQALLSLGKSDLRSFNATQRSLYGSGSALGSFIGSRRFGAEIAHDRAVVRIDREQLHRENAMIDRLGHRIARQLERGIKHLSNPQIDVYFDGKKIARVSATGSNRNARRT
jgi:TP901 family phage tail tape measure protein